MKWLGKRFRTGFCVLSLLAALTALAWLVRSYSRADHFTLEKLYLSGEWDVHHEVNIYLVHGELRLSLWKDSESWPDRETAELYVEGMNRYDPKPLIAHESVPPKEQQDLIEESNGPMGFRWSRQHWEDQHSVNEKPQPKISDSYLLAMPLWSPALILCMLPAVTVIRDYRRRRRVSTGRCASCGYDLRATPGRCPECGAAAQPA